MLSNLYPSVDQGLIAGEIKWTRDLAIDYAQGVHCHRASLEMAEVKAISMLGLETLLMCRAFAIESTTGVLEIGPYIGGSTIALAMGLKDCGRSHIVSVDHGGSYPGKTLPTDDVHQDWRRNLAGRSLDQYATLVAGISTAPDVVDEVTRLAGGHKYDVLLIDADGEVDAQLRAYSHVLADDCLLIIDDYYNVMGEAGDKADRCASQLHDLMRDGVVHQYVLVPWGTWFGRLNGPL